MVKIRRIVAKEIRPQAEIEALDALFEQIRQETASCEAPGEVIDLDPLPYPSLNRER